MNFHDLKREIKKHKPYLTSIGLKVDTNKHDVILTTKNVTITLKLGQLQVTSYYAADSTVTLPIDYPVVPAVELVMQKTDVLFSNREYEFFHPIPDFQPWLDLLTQEQYKNTVYETLLVVADWLEENKHTLHKTLRWMSDNLVFPLVQKSAVNFRKNQFAHCPKVFNKLRKPQYSQQTTDVDLYHAIKHLEKVL